EACGRLFRKLGYKSRDLNYKKGRVKYTPFSLLDIVNRVLLPQFVNIVFITVFVRLLLEGLQNLAYSIRIICRTLIDVWNFGFDYFIAQLDIVHFNLAYLFLNSLLTISYAFQLSDTFSHYTDFSQFVHLTFCFRLL